MIPPHAEEHYVFDMGIQGLLARGELLQRKDSFIESTHTLPAVTDAHLGPHHVQTTGAQPTSLSQPA